MNDNEIKAFFQTHRPLVEEGESFDNALQKKMEALSALKEQHDKTIHRYRLILVATTLVGIAVGGAIMLFILSHPQQHLELQFYLSLKSFIATWKSYFFLLVVAGAITFGLLPHHLRITSNK